MPVIDSAKKTLPADAVYAIGNFDGVHMGHRQLFNICKSFAEKSGCAICALTFEGLSKGGGRLITSADRELYLKDAGAEAVLCEAFDEIKNMSPEEFTKSYIVKKLAPSAVVCGENFRFGRGGSGNAELLRNLLAEAGIPLLTAPTVISDGSAISTSRIKEVLSEGAAEEAEKLLGRKYSFSYTVETGKQLGRSLGSPTVNQRFPEGMFVPRLGVYAGKVILNGRIYKSVTNIGRRPSVSDGDHITAESHIIGYSGNLYGRAVRICLSRFLRDEMEFSSLDELAGRISADIKLAESE